MTRQQRWQIKQIAQGNCRQCGKKRGFDSVIYCDTCQRKRNEAYRRSRKALT